MKEKLKITKLENGARIVTKQMAGEAFAVAFSVNFGSYDEKPGQEGWCHVLEHTLFQGCGKFPTQTAISHPIESCGGWLNGYTSGTQTCYYAEVPADHADRAVEALGEMFTRPLLKATNLRKELEVVCNEIRMYKDDIGSAFSGAAVDALWPNSPYGKPIEGTEESVRACDVEALRAFYEAGYRGGDVVIALAGPRMHEEMVAMVKPFALRFPGGRKPKRPRPADVKAPVPVIAVRDKRTKGVRVQLSFRLKGRRPAREVFFVLVNLLSGCTGGLVKRVNRRFPGTHYSASADPLLGDFSIDVDLPPEETLTASFRAVCAELRALKAGRFSGKELEKVKERLANHSIDRAPETALGVVYNVVADFAGSGLIEEREETARKRRRVTAEQVTDLAKRLFVTEQSSLAVLQPTGDGALVETLRDALAL